MMSIIKRALYQKRKYDLRHISIPPVNNIIFSEDSAFHWKFLEVKGLNVLDLGIGRWGTTSVQETSPIYFKEKGAKKIIGVDMDEGEVNFFNEYFTKHYNDGSKFVRKFIDNKADIENLIIENDINSIKCDIEGGEINLFKLNMSQNQGVKHLSIEYHSPVLLKELISINKYWNFKIIDHSIFSIYPHMGVLTLTRI